MRILSILFIVIFIQFPTYAVEYIAYQDNQRCMTYNQNRNESLAKPFTDNIARKLTDHASIDYSRTATEAEREKIYKAIFGTIFVHSGRFERLYQQTNYTDHRYQSHFNALQVVDQSARVLWAGVQTGSYIHSFEQANSDFFRLSVSKGFRHQELLTTNFIKWFYEALESYRHELNFFGSTATLEWFQQIAPCYQKSVSIKGENLKILLTKDYKQTGIYKSLSNTSTKTTGRDRQVKAEYTSWLLAKAAGLTRVVNPVIPVRITSAGLVIDPENYQGTLEPFVGLPVYEYSNTAFSFFNHKPMNNYHRDLRSLFSWTMNYSKIITLEANRENRSSQPFDSRFPNLGQLPTIFEPPFAEPRAFLKIYFPAINIDDFAIYFSSSAKERRAENPLFTDISDFREDAHLIRDILEAASSQTVQSTDIDSRDPVFEKLETFNRCISKDDLLLLIAFWHITQQDDMNPSNILFRPTAEGHIVPTVIDYDISLGSNDGILKRVPMLNTLKQATEIFSYSLVQKIKDISTARLLQVMNAYESRRKPSADNTKYFSCWDNPVLSQRLANVKTAVSTTNNLRKLIHALIPHHFKDIQYQPEQALLDLRDNFEEELRCTIVDPILQTPSLIPNKEYLGRYTVVGTGSEYSRIKSWLYPLEWVFAADRKTFQEGENDGTNLKGYLPFNTENLLCGLGI